MKNKPKCSYCGKEENLKYYIIADDLEHPKPMHEKCYKEFSVECLIKYCNLLEDQYWGKKDDN